MKMPKINGIEIKKEDTWIDVETVAHLKNITRRAVRMSLNNDKYEYKTEKCRGWYLYKIRLSTLEVEYQKKIIEEYVAEINASNSEVIELGNLKIKQEKLISESQKKMSLAKYDLINFWIDFRKNYKNNKIPMDSKSINKHFLDMYNSGMLYENIYNILGTICEGSLYRWKRLLGYNRDWTVLVSQYKYSTRKEYNTFIAHFIIYSPIN